MHVAIVGGGAAGLMTAAAILETDPTVEVFLIERNDGLGKKVIISGGGRCNVTTGILDVKAVLAKYPRGGKFLNSAIRQFPPQAVYDWFESHGVPLKTQDDQRVFPRSDDGHDVVRAFERLFRDHANMHVLLNRHVAGVSRRDDGRFEVRFKASAPSMSVPPTIHEPLVVDRLVLTTGGQAYRVTGSTGDGYAFAQSLGHSLTKLAPSLNSFGTAERWTADVSGVSFPDARLSTDRVLADGTKPSFRGPFLFTHRGISGPAVFALSALVAFERYDKELPLNVLVDLFPDESRDALRERVQSLMREHARKDALNVISMVVTRSLATVLNAELALPTQNAGDVSKADAARVADWLKGIPLRAVSRGAGDEFVTAGGVPLAEVDPSTMESRICPGLFFAGEILDVDGFTGGFNLQASWAAGRLAGTSIASGC